MLLGAWAAAVAAASLAREGTNQDYNNIMIMTGDIKELPRACCCYCGLIPLKLRDFFYLPAFSRRMLLRLTVSKRLE